MATAKAPAIETDEASTPELENPASTPELPIPTSTPESPNPALSPEPPNPASTLELPNPASTPEPPNPASTPELQNPASTPELPIPASTPESPNPASTPESPNPASDPEPPNPVSNPEPPNPASNPEPPNPASNPEPPNLTSNPEPPNPASNPEPPNHVSNPESSNPALHPEAPIPGSESPFPRKRKTAPKKRKTASKKRKIEPKKKQKGTPAATGSYTKDEIRKYSNDFNKNHCIYCTSFENDKNDPFVLKQHLKSSCVGLKESNLMLMKGRRKFAQVPFSHWDSKGIPMTALKRLFEDSQVPDDTLVAPLWYLNFSFSANAALTLTLPSYDGKEINDAFEEELKSAVAGKTKNKFVFVATFTNETGAGSGTGSGLPQFKNMNHAALLIVERPPGGKFKARYYDSINSTRIFRDKIMGNSWRMYMTRLFGQSLSILKRDIDFFPSLTSCGCLAVVAFYLGLVYAGKAIQKPPSQALIHGLKLRMHDMLRVGTPSARDGVQFT